MAARQQIDAQKEEEQDAAPLFPLLNKESVEEYLPALATAALLGVTAINVLSSTQGQDPLAKDAKHKTIRKFLVGMPYSIFPAGLAGLAAALVASKRRPRLLGFAAGFLLGELLYLILMGGLVTLVRTEAPSRIVWPVTGAILVTIFVAWSLLCAYPKCLRCILCGCWCCCKGKCCSKVKDGNNTSAQKRCETCGGMTVNGRSPTAAPPGTAVCPECGAVAPAPTTVPSQESQLPSPTDDNC